MVFVLPVAFNPCEGYSVAEVRESFREAADVLRGAPFVHDSVRSNGGVDGVLASIGDMMGDVCKVAVTPVHGGGVMLCERTSDGWAVDAGRSTWPLVSCSGVLGCAGLAEVLNGFAIGAVVVSFHVVDDTHAQWYRALEDATRIAAYHPGVALVEYES